MMQPRIHRTPSKPLRIALEFGCDDLGASLVELALVLVFFGPLMIFGLAELGGLAYDYIEVCSSAHSGAEYVSQYYHANASTLPTATQIGNAVGYDSQDLKVTPTVSAVTGCTGGTSPISYTVPSCSGTAQPFVQVTVTATVTPLIVSNLFPSSFTLRNSAQMTLVGP